MACTKIVFIAGEAKIADDCFSTFCILLTLVRAKSRIYLSQAKAKNVSLSFHQLRNDYEIQAIHPTLYLLSGTTGVGTEFHPMVEAGRCGRRKRSAQDGHTILAPHSPRGHSFGQCCPIAPRPLHRTGDARGDCAGQWCGDAPTHRDRIGQRKAAGGTRLVAQRPGTPVYRESTQRLERKRHSRREKSARLAARIGATNGAARRGPNSALRHTLCHGARQ